MGGDIRQKWDRLGSMKHYEGNKAVWCDSALGVPLNLSEEGAFLKRW